jgi:hypothetical protein
MQPFTARTRARLLVAMGVGLTASLIGTGLASAAEPTVGLGTATTYAILSGQAISNTGPSTVSGDIGISPGGMGSIVGYSDITHTGALHAADGEALTAQNNLTTAYNDAAGRTPTALTGVELGGSTLLSGVYAGGTQAITGTLTLDAQGDPAAVWVFQSAATLITASASQVLLTNGANPCNVFWQVSSSATLGTNSDFVGTIMALTSITATTGARIQGRLLARNGAVTLDTNTITAGNCAVTPAVIVPSPTTTTIAATATTADASATTAVPTTVPVAESIADESTTTIIPGSDLFLPRTGRSNGMSLTIAAATSVAGIVVVRTTRRRRPEPTS